MENGSGRLGWRVLIGKGSRKNGKMVKGVRGERVRGSV